MRYPNYLFFAVALFLGACGGAGNDPGSNALLRVDGAQYVEGQMSEETGGPRVVSVDNSRTRIVIGERRKPLRGTLERAANAVAIELTGDTGHWILTAGAPNVDTPDLLSFDTRLEFSHALPEGPVELSLRAVDREQRFGPASNIQLEANYLALPAGELVVRLEWATNADLDLHLVDPAGTVIWARDPTSYKPPGPGEEELPNAKERAGIYSGDSNSTCKIDGRRAEYVTYQLTPPPGIYTVRVDSFSLCGQPSAPWTVEAILRGESLGRARGQLLPAHTRGPHDARAGITALTFEVTE